MHPTSIRLGLKKRKVSIDLKLRWDKSPWTCKQIVDQIPFEQQIWHAKWANSEVYTLIPAGDEPYRGEWESMYPAPGDLMFIPIRKGFIQPPGSAQLDVSRDHIDIAFFYERGSNLYGPSGLSFGNIFATATDIPSLEKMAEACADIWFSGADGEKFYLQALA